MLTFFLFIFSIIYIFLKIKQTPSFTHYQSNPEVQTNILNFVNQFEKIEEVTMITIGSNGSNLANKRVPKILLWTTFFGEHPLRILNPIGNRKQLALRNKLYDNCNYKCKFISNTSQYLTSDAIIFSATDLRK